MRPLVLLKWSFLLGSLGVALLLAPACKAQSEIAPDQFDQPNTEPFEKRSTVPAPEANQTNHKAVSKQKTVAAKGQPHKPSPNQSTQLLAARDLSQPAGKDAVVVQTEPKTTQRKPKDE
jgi:hypothetical protein